METLYSKIIRDKLRLPTYSLHKQPWQKTQHLVCEYLHTLTLAEFVSLFEQQLHCVEFQHTVGFSNGYFHRLIQQFDGELENQIIIHDNEVVSTIILLLVKAGISKQEAHLIYRMYSMYLDKLNNC